MLVKASPITESTRTSSRVRLVSDSVDVAGHRDVLACRSALSRRLVAQGGVSVVVLNLEPPMTNRASNRAPVAGMRQSFLSRLLTISM
jgi:hypothetical protein